MKRGLILLASFVIMASDALAADGQAPGLAYTPPTMPGAPDPSHLLLRLLGMTSALLVFCVVVVWLARRANRPAMPAANSEGRMRLEGTLSLDRRSAVHLVRVEGQTVAVTTDATGLRSIVVLSEPFEQVLDEARNPEEEASREAA